MRLAEALEAAIQLRGGPSGNLRHLLRDVPEIAGLARSKQVLSAVETFLGGRAFPVRAILFDKTPSANWSVGWHQDLAISVRQRVDAPGFYGWSEKDGIVHVMAPAQVLEQMVTVRIHLDDCDVANGALQVVPGSHLAGVLDAAGIRQRSKAGVTCVVPQGGALLMRPLHLHASHAAQSRLHRRVVHLEYACRPLPCGLQWHEEVAS